MHVAFAISTIVRIVITHGVPIFFSGGLTVGRRTSFATQKVAEASQRINSEYDTPAPPGADVTVESRKMNEIKHRKLTTIHIYISSSPHLSTKQL